MVLPSSSEARKCLEWHVDCWDTVKDPHDHDDLAFAGPGVQMKLARLIQINAMDAALLSAVPPKALPRPSRVPLSFFALNNSQDHQRLAFSALTPEQIQTSVTRLGGSVANACSGMRMSASDREETKSSLVSSNGRFLSKRGADRSCSMARWSRSSSAPDSARVTLGGGAPFSRAVFALLGA